MGSGGIVKSAARVRNKGDEVTGGLKAGPSFDWRVSKEISLVPFDKNELN